MLGPIVLSGVYGGGWAHSGFGFVWVSGTYGPIVGGEGLSGYSNLRCVSGRGMDVGVCSGLKYGE